MARPRRVALEEAASNTQEAGPVYHMVTGVIDEGRRLRFLCEADKIEAFSVGFFRVEAPRELQMGLLEEGRRFAKTFSSLEKYVNFGNPSDIEGFMADSPVAQTVRFSLERDRWDAYPPSMQKLANLLHFDIGLPILNSVLEETNIPHEHHFQATAGTCSGHGSHFLLFNYYDPANANREFGVAPHVDWGYVTVLDAVQPGLEAFVRNQWRPIELQDGYLTINFGYALELVAAPIIHASIHRVVTQTALPRSSTVAFLDPRRGPYNDTAPEQWRGLNGSVCSWNGQELVNSIDTYQWNKELSYELFGEYKQ